MRQTTKLKHCDLTECEAICCYNGVWLTEQEAIDIHTLVEQHPEHFQHLPKDYIIRREGNIAWTALHPHRYRNKPRHFDNTRCVFAESDGKCSLQTLAIAHGKHKWTYKPIVCWMCPLQPESRWPIAPQRDHEHDALRNDRYPGFQTYIPCGRHQPQGKVWWIALKEELQYYRERFAKSAPDWPKES